MAILNQFGIDVTVFFHMIIFMIAIIFLTNVIFKPYLKALEMREQRTKGGEALAGEIQKDSADLRARYEVKAKEISHQIKSIYDDFRGQANKEYESILVASRADAKKNVDQVRSRVADELGNAEKQIREQTSVVAQTVVTKLLAQK
jgi:F0F1-type ATP synthase membrane subunit b/b'